MNVNKTLYHPYIKHIHKTQHSYYKTVTRFLHQYQRQNRQQKKHCLQNQ